MVECNSAEIRSFLETIHAAAASACEGIAKPGMLQIFRAHPDRKDTRTFPFPIGAVEAMAAQAEADARAGFNVYVEGRTVTPGRGRGDATATRAVFALVADDDHDTGNQWSDALEPSLIVSTSPGNSHRWHFLSRAIEHQEAAAIGLGMKATGGGDGDTGVPTQPYRVAGTPNYPSEVKRQRGRAEATPTSVMEASGAIYSADALRYAFPSPATVASERSSVAATGISSQEAADLFAAPVEDRDRSKAFQAAVAKAAEAGMAPGEIEDLARQYPDGCAQKYLRPRDRLAAEIERSCRKWRSEGGLTDAEVASIIAPFMESIDAKLGRQSASARRAIEIVNAASLAASEPLPRRFHVPGMIPAGTVTSLYGDGGTGKSLLALQLAAATAGGVTWLGLPVEPGPCVFLTAEDDIHEVHRRLLSICQGDGISLASLSDLAIVPLAGEDAVLAAPDSKAGQIRATPLFKAIESAVARLRPRLVVLDTAADLFAGNEIDRVQVRQFIGMLRGLAIHHDTTVVLLAHPSVAGMANGSGMSGSTAWNNSVRSRLFLRRLIQGDGRERSEADPDARQLEVLKTNYGRTGEIINLRWVDGRFQRDGSLESFGTASAMIEARMKAEFVFKDLLVAFLADDRNVSSSPCATYAPLVFSRHERSQGVSKKAFVDAMNRLFERGEIINEAFGPPSTRRHRIAFADRPGDAA